MRHPGPPNVKHPQLRRVGFSVSQRFLKPPLTPSFNSRPAWSNLYGATVKKEKEWSCTLGQILPYHVSLRLAPFVFILPYLAVLANHKSGHHPATHSHHVTQTVSFLLAYHATIIAARSLLRSYKLTRHSWPTSLPSGPFYRRIIY